jgi:hypothetical protein
VLDISEVIFTENRNLEIRKDNLRIKLRIGQGKRLDCAKLKQMA